MLKDFKDRTNGFEEQEQSLQAHMKVPLDGRSVALTLTWDSCNIAPRADVVDLD